MGNSQNKHNSSLIRTSKFGWKPDLPDNRDHVVDFPEHVIDRIEHKINIGKYFHTYYDEQNTGMNTACTVASAINFEVERVSGSKFISSPSFLYYTTRYLEGKEDYDSCVGIRDTINCLNKIGICTEQLFPSSNKINHSPNTEEYNQAKECKGFIYKIIKPNLEQIKACITLRRPILFGYSVPKQYDNPNWNTELEPLMPPKTKGKLLGGRTGLIIGYNDEKQILKVMDTRGKNWGNDGNFNMHYSMVEKGLCINFCTIEKKLDNTSISQLEKPKYSEIVKKKKRKKRKNRQKKSLGEESVESLSEYESEYEHIEDTKEDKPPSQSEIDKQVEEILGEEFPEMSDNESNYKEINISTKKKRRRRRKKKKKKKEEEEENETLKEFAFRTEK